jgi:hypothetical protein
LRAELIVGNLPTPQFGDGNPPAFIGVASQIVVGHHRSPGMKMNTPSSRTAMNASHPLAHGY